VSDDITTISSRAFQWSEKGALNLSELGHFQVPLGDKSFIAPFGYSAEVNLKGKILSMNGTVEAGEAFSCHYAK